MVRTLAFSVAFSFACAEGQSLPVGFDDTDSEGGGGAGGDGGASTSAQNSIASGPSTASGSGAGGEGGAPSSSGATTSGGSEFQNVLMMAGGGTATVASVFQLGSNQSWASPFLVETWDRTALVVTPASTAYGLMRADSDGSVYFVSWAGGTMWSQDPTLVPGGPASSRPHAAADGEEVHVVFRGVDGEVRHSVLENGSVISTGTTGAITSGPPSVVVTSTGPVLVFIGSDGLAHTRMNQGNAWIDGPTLASDLLAPRTPAVAREGDGSLTAAFVRASDQSILVATLQGSTWTAPQVIPNAFSAEDPQLALGETAGALAFRGLDHFGYVVRRTAGTFQPVEPIFSSNPELACAPSIAIGASGADFEVVFVDTLALGHWTRFEAGAFTPPTFIGAAGPPSCITVAVAP